MSQWASALEKGEISSVSVNQRALVEKILARYSGDYTVYRELLQNADDAKADTVSIHFCSPDYDSSSATTTPDSILPNLKNQMTGSIVVKNNGISFRTEDWERLKKIAEGNPDVASIGAFGVGFYSLFSVCDDPVVVSGGRLMKFFWKDGGDQLYVKTAAVETGEEEKELTTFSMELREPGLLPDPMEFSRFLCTALGFTRNIKNINFHFNQFTICRLAKILSPPSSIPLLPSLPSTSPIGVLNLKVMEEEAVQIRVSMPQFVIEQAEKAAPITVATVAASSTSFASKMLSAFTTSIKPPPPPPAATKKLLDIVKSDPLSLLSSTLFFKIVSTTAKVTPSTHFSNEMIRWTKKALPKMTTLSIIYYSKDELEACDSKSFISRIFEGLRTEGRDAAKAEAVGKIFIGFQTFQTTGFSGQVAGRFVSTVERESLDFQSAIVGDWNRELLWVVGVTARSIYEREMKGISDLWKKTESETSKLEASAIHLTRFFEMAPSTPSPIVGTSIEIGFFAGKGNLTIISSKGPRPANEVRLPNPGLDGFYKGAVVLDGVGNSMVEKYKKRKLIEDISLNDVLADLATRALSEGELTFCLTWWIQIAKNRSYDPTLLSRLKSSVILSSEDKFLPLDQFIFFQNPKVISVDLPVPSDSCLPFTITKNMNTSDLVMIFKLEELSVLGWMEFIVSPSMIGSSAKLETNLLLSPHFAEKVLTTIAKSWITIPSAAQQNIVKLLSLPFLPTTKGIRLPKDVYLPSVTLLDLPRVSLPSGTIKNNIETLLLAIGVRNHVELQLVFAKLGKEGEDGEAGWDVVKLVKYLASITTLSTYELERLSKTSWLPAGGQTEQKGKRFIASELYMPSAEITSLGLPVLEWNKWRASSDEAKFLFSIGLQRVVPLSKLLEIAAGTDSVKRTIALDYLLSEWTENSYGTQLATLKNIPAFVPAIRNKQAILLRPNEVFESSGSSCLGFAIIDPRYSEHATKLQCSSHPPASDLARALLAQGENSIAISKSQFAYLSTQVSGFSSSSLSTLKVSKIIPILDPITNKVSLVRPDAAFFSNSSSNTSIPPGLETLFAKVPVELSSTDCHPFLVAVGVRDSPSVIEIAAMLVQDQSSPARFLELCDQTDRYLSILRMIAVNFDRFPSGLKSRMRLSSFLIGYKRTIIQSKEVEDEEESTLEPVLSQASNLVVVDDTVSAYLFSQDLLISPQEEILEKLAESLGSSKLSKLIRADYRVNGEPRDSQQARKVQQLVAERVLLFLADRKSSEKYLPEFFGKSLKVLQVPSIEIIRTLSLPGNRSVRNKTEATIKITVEKNSSILILISEQEIDLFELAESLCGVILKKRTSNDSLLLNTILSTSLKLLKRRGFNVDRILNGRKAVAQAAAQVATQAAAQEMEKAKAIDSDLEKLSSMFPDADPAHLRSLLQQESLEESLNSLLDGNYPRRQQESRKPAINSTSRPVSTSNPSPPIPAFNSPTSPPLSRPPTDSMFSNFRKKLLNRDNPMPEGSALGRGLGNGSMSTGGTQTAGTPSSQEAIQDNLRKAIQASRPETSSNFNNKVEKTMIKEPEGNYCDASAGANLISVGEVRGMKVYFDRGVDVKNFQLHEAALDRFISRILLPIAQVFGVDKNALHCFYDATGPLIAFNRGGALYLNLRYYLAWHDEAVIRNDLNDALISWFHSLAHELSHNLVKPHDSAFSYYFSSLCEMHFVKMSAILQK